MMTLTVSALTVAWMPLADAAVAPRTTNVDVVLGLVMFGAAAFLFAFVGLSIGWIVRPTQPHPEKATAYECGEPAIGESWVQFDLRFYTVALVFIVFDVEVALLWPWAVAFKQMGAPAFWAFLVFFLLIAIPFLYEWKSGYLDWVRAATGQRSTSVLGSDAAPVGAGSPVEAPQDAPGTVGPDVGVAAMASTGEATG